MFVKMKSYQQNQEYAAIEKAEKYVAWLANNGRDAKAVTSNEYLASPSKYKAAKVLLAQARGSKCFDVDYYTSRNADLVVLAGSREAAWQHYVYNGQFEARKVRFTCEADFRHVLQPPSRR